MRYKSIAIHLFKLLDNIDTASDMAKGNDAAYRAIVEKLQRKRFEVMTTDGYKIYRYGWWQKLVFWWQKRVKVESKPVSSAEANDPK